ncbi:MAG: type II toxin-antitoxin system VapC family toxin [Actinomycetota bacterium]|nr:PIN domain-containing protein [Actinomycetota bacterium]
MKFVDTSFWVGLRFRRDSRHEDAKNVWQAGPGALITTDLVIGETWTFLRRKAGHMRAAEFFDATTKLSTLTIRHVDEDLVAEAWRWLRRHDERDYSFVDATSFALMRRLRLKDALAFDGDFSAAGFVEVRPGR